MSPSYTLYICRLYLVALNGSVIHTWFCITSHWSLQVLAHGVLGSSKWHHISLSDFQKSHTCYYHHGLHWEGFWVLRRCQTHGGRYNFPQIVSFSFQVERRDWQQMLLVVCPETIVFLNSCWRKMCAEHPSLKFVCQSNFYIKISHRKDKLSSLLTGQHNIGGRYT